MASKARRIAEIIIGYIWPGTEFSRAANGSLQFRIPKSLIGDANNFRLKIDEHGENHVFVVGLLKVKYGIWPCFWTAKYARHRINHELVKSLETLGAAMGRALKKKQMESK